ncbi:MAG: DUF1565 domain-containing protein [Deltaproteobacteria bacterium]|nr:DUF1565 domain-containing protein [Deltaproteobacteria bacterium]
MTSPRTGALAAFGVCLSACGQRELPPLSAPEGAKSILLAARTADRVIAHASMGSDWTGTLDPGTLTAFFFDRSLVELDLPEGDVHLLSQGTEVARKVPVWIQANQLTEEANEWVDGADPATLTHLRLPIVDRRRCVGRGGCFPANAITEEDLFCMEPCAVEDPALPEPPVPPEPVESPRLVPCPFGWAAVATEGSAICSPPAVSELVCSPGSARFGSDTCAPVGSECPAVGEFGDTSGATLFVSVGAEPAGDGSRARPFRTISAAVSAARAGEVIALAMGRYSPPVPVEVPVTVMGACPLGTVLESHDPLASAFVVIAPGVTIRNLGIERVNHAFAVASSGSLTVSDVVISDVDVGVAAEGSVELRRVDLRRARVGLALRAAEAKISELSMSQLASYGLLAERGAEVRATNLDLRDATQGLIALTGARLVLSHGSVRSSGEMIRAAGAHLELDDVVLSSTVGAGIGVKTADGATVVARQLHVDNVFRGMELCGATATVSDAVVSRSSGTGILACGGPVKLERISISDVPVGLDVRQAKARASDLDCRRVGFCVEVLEGAELELDHAWVAGVNIGVCVQPGGRATISDFTATGEMVGEAGVESQGATILRRARISRFAGFGVAVHAGELSGSDLEIDDITPTVEGSGVAVFAQRGTTGRFERVRLWGRHGSSLFRSFGGAMELRDFRVESDPDLGHAAIENWGGPMTIDRVSVEGGEFGILTSSDVGRPDMVLEDGLVATNVEVAASRRAGIAAFHLADMRASRVSIANAAGAGILATDDSSAFAEDVTIRGTRLGTYGGAVVAAENGQLSLHRFSLQDGDSSGLVFAGSMTGSRLGRLEVSEGVVRGHRVGLELRGADEDLRAYLSKVRYEDNAATFVVGGQ